MKLSFVPDDDGRAAASTTDGYIRRVAGAVVEPVRRPIQPTNGS